MRYILISIAAALVLSAPVPAQTTTPLPSATPSGQTMWYTHQAEEMPASKLIGTTVVNTVNASATSTRSRWAGTARSPP